MLHLGDGTVPAGLIAGTVNELAITKSADVARLYLGAPGQSDIIFADPDSSFNGKYIQMIQQDGHLRDQVPG